MEPNKLENQIQKKLNSRDIQPSAQAWDRLDAMLSIAEGKKPKRKMPWLFIAATFTGFFMLAVFLLNQNKDEQTILNNGNAVVNVTKPIEDSSSVARPVIIENKKVIQKSLLIPQKNKIMVAESKKESTKPEKQVLKIQNITEEPKEIIVAVIPEKTIEKKKLEINPEVLLASIENENTQNKTNPKSKIKIDPSSLLSQVDGEIELSFRQKVIKTINKNYNSTKIALATRNQE